MSNIINYNELRKLAIKVGKTRPILSCIKIQDGKAYFTNAIYLVVMEGYQDSEDGVFFMGNYKRCVMDYPNVDFIINQEYKIVEFEKVILNDKVVYKLGGWCIDDEILTQLKKLVTMKNFTIDVNKIKVSGINLKLELPDGSLIIFTPKRFTE